MKKLFCVLIWLFKKSKAFSALSCRLTKFTGKSKYAIHPKHLIKKDEAWYLKDIKKDDLVLDLGCGNGQHSLRVAKKCRKVIGVDYNQKQLEIALKTANDRGIKNIEFLKLNLEQKLPFENSSFDTILALDILEHLNKRKQFLKEIKRVLKNKGTIFITAPNKDTSWKKIQKKVGLNYYSDPDHKMEYSLKKIRKILLSQGFKIVKIEPIVYDTPFVGFIDLAGGASLNLYKKLTQWKKNKVKNSFIESTGFRIKAKILL